MARRVDARLPVGQGEVEGLALGDVSQDFSQCWSDQHYHYIHSGAGSRKSSGGVLVILSRQLTHSQAIRYHEAIPGHLLRVSFTPHGSSCAFNLIGLYQHVWTSGNLSIRHAFWTKLSGLCHSIPARSCLLLAGDCNATCQPEGRLVGSGVPKSFVAEDSSELQDILRAHGLVALNTFGQAPGHTFRFGPRASQLDYVFTRIAHADREAKLAKANYDFPVGRHVSADAAYHFPISTTIACSWHTRPHCTHRFNIDVHRLAEDVQKGSKGKYEVFSEITRNWSTKQPMDASDPVCGLVHFCFAVRKVCPKMLLFCCSNTSSIFPSCLGCLHALAWVLFSVHLCLLGSSTAARCFSLSISLVSAIFRSRV